MSTLFLFKGYLSYSGVSDQYIDDTIVEALISDRKNIFVDQLQRTLFFISIAYLIIFLFLKSKLSKQLLIISFGVIICYDLISFSKNYVNSENFVDPVFVENPFNKDDVYQLIAQDESDFRILDLTENSTKPNYFFNSVNGYHAAKLGRYNDLMEFYLNKTHLNTLSMLNTKYIIFEKEGVKEIYQNDNASGSAWFVKENIKVLNDDEEIKRLDSLNFRDVSVSQSFSNKTYQNINSSVLLSEKSSNYIKYNVSTDDLSLIIFSEIFYPKGWKSYINGNQVVNHRFNYTLRGLEVPRGNHKIEFIFDPNIVKLSSRISLFSSLGFVLLVFILALRRKN